VTERDGGFFVEPQPALGLSGAGVPAWLNRRPDSNLSLTATQMAEHLAKRKEMWETGENQVGQLGPPEIGYKKSPAQNKQFAADTADKTGVNKATGLYPARRGFSLSNPNAVSPYVG